MTINATLTATASGYLPVWSAHVTLAPGSDPLTDGRLVWELDGSGEVTHHANFLPYQAGGTTSKDWSFVPPSGSFATCTVKLYNGSTLLYTVSSLSAVDAYWTGWGWMSGRCPSGQIVRAFNPVMFGQGSPGQRLWQARGAAFNILGSSVPLYVSDVRQGDVIDVSVLADDEYDVEQLVAWLAFGEPVLIQTATPDPFGSGTFWVGDVTAVKVAGDTTTQLVTLPLVRVAEVRL